MFALVCTRDGRTERHLLATGDTTVGRSPLCDLVIPDPSISRRHARFRVHGDHCLLTDLGGRNGTFVNGEPIAEAEVTAGDTITLGRFPLTLQRAADAGFALGGHQPALDAPTTVCRRADDAMPASGPWRLSADADRLVELLSVIARRLTTWTSPRYLLDQIAAAALEVVPADRSFLLLADPAGRGTPVPYVARSRDGSAPDPAAISRHIVDRVIDERLAILSTDLVPDEHPRADADSGLSAARSFICVPLFTQRGTLGALYVDAPEARPLLPADLDVIQALAVHAAAAVCQARDVERMLREARRETVGS